MKIEYYPTYPIGEIPEELLAKHPNHAVYLDGTRALFCEPLEAITGIPTPLQDIIDYRNSEYDEDYLLAEEDKVTYTGTPDERKAKRIEARTQIRIDIRVAERTLARILERQTERKETRIPKKIGRKLYDDKQATLPPGE